MYFRTDLALELKENLQGDLNGIKCEEKVENDVHISTITVENENGEKLIGKPRGKYITFTFPSISDDASPAEERAQMIAKHLSGLLPDGLVLVAGLGNTEITPDALGPYTAARVLATRHINDEIKRASGLDDLNPVAVISPGVLGKTGIETFEIIKGIVDSINPSAVIAVDAFASKSLSRLGTTVQIASSGISPGSGVKNKRKELSRESLGVPVISIGVPTVVDGTTLAAELLEDESDSVMEKVRPEGRDMFVTPREIDLIISRSSRFLSLALNLALQPEYSAEEIESLVI